MYKEDLALNNLQWLICHKSQPNQTKVRAYYMKKFIFSKISLFKVKGRRYTQKIMIKDFFSMRTVLFSPEEQKFNLKLSSMSSYYPYEIW